MIKYQFAYDCQQKIVDIKNLIKTNKTEGFTCLSCGNALIPVLGEIKEHHFRHKLIVKNCSQETYLHKLAKHKFYETYNKCLKSNKPFIINMKVDSLCDFYEGDFLTICNLKSQMYQFELTQSFKEIYLERKEASFIPDVLLEDRDTGRKIFFEVFVTNPSSRLKLNSNYMIIEFKIDSEKDIEEIESCLISESSKVKFINFYKKLKTNHCNGKCFQGIIPYSSNELLYNIFAVFKYGDSSFISNLRLEDIESLRHKILHLEYLFTVEPPNVIRFPRDRVFTNPRTNLRGRSCFLCIHHQPNISLDREGTIFCQSLNKTGNSNMGSKCHKFCADPYSFNKYKYIEYIDIIKYDDCSEYDNLIEDKESWFR